MIPDGRAHDGDFANPLASDALAAHRDPASRRPVTTAVRMRPYRGGEGERPDRAGRHDPAGGTSTLLAEADSGAGVLDLEHASAPARAPQPEEEPLEECRAPVRPDLQPDVVGRGGREAADVAAVEITVN